MVETPTSFIVGAGASNCYGLPLGSKLLERAKSLSPDSAVYHLARRHTAIPVERLNAILENLKQFPGPSIDDYLEKRQTDPDTQRLGRTLIAAFMAQALQTELNLRPPAVNDWLKSLFLQMAEGADTFERFVEGNKITFVTFNFDSVIEARLEGLARDTYGAIDPQVLAKAVPVIHVHGRLPSPPSIQLGFEPHSSEPSPEWLSWIPDAASSVRVVFDSDIDEPTLLAACAALVQSQILCFLGFSYHPRNVERLSLGLWNKSAGRLLFGTTTGMSNGERQRAKRRLHHAAPSATLDDHGSHCRPYLEATDIYI